MIQLNLTNSFSDGLKTPTRINCTINWWNACLCRVMVLLMLLAKSCMLFFFWSLPFSEGHWKRVAVATFKTSWLYRSDDEPYFLRIHCLSIIMLDICSYLVKNPNKQPQNTAYVFVYDKLTILFCMINWHGNKTSLISRFFTHWTRGIFIVMSVHQKTSQLPIIWATARCIKLP